MYRERNKNHEPECAFRDCGLFQGLCFAVRSASHIANLAASQRPVYRPIRLFSSFYFGWLFVVGIFARIVCMCGCITTAPTRN